MTRAEWEKLVKDFLTKKNFQVLEAGNGEEAMDIFYEEKDIALIILDVMMPKMDGWEVCREIRKNSKVPIIMLTARSDERDELLGFDLGVDEYISKPFSPKSLLQEWRQFWDVTGQNNPEDVISAGGIVIDKAAHLATVDGKPMELSFKEFELLTYFLENQGIALSREKILNSVWNYDYFGDARTIDTHVKKLRSKMGDKGEYIKTVWGMGYKFEVDEWQETEKQIKKFHTLQHQISVVFICLLLLSIFTITLINGLFLEKYYVSKKVEVLEEAKEVLSQMNLDDILQYDTDIEEDKKGATDEISDEIERSSSKK